MGHDITYRRQETRRAALAVLGVSLLCLALAVPALAALPNHPHKPALDIATGLNHACGTAVDSKGDVYVSSAGESKVKVFGPSHTLLASISNSNEPCGLAVNSKGDLFVSEQATGNVVRYKPNAYPLSGSPAYGPAEAIDSSGIAKGIAVDRFDNRLYVAKGTRVDLYSPAGTPGIDEEQGLILSGASGGDFKLLFKGQETGPIAWNATSPEVQAALEALPAIGAGNVSVAEGAGFEKHRVAFRGALGGADVEPLQANTTGLTGFLSIETRAGGFDGHLGEGELSAATGVAAYTYLSFKGGGGEVLNRYLYVADPAGAEPDRVDVFSGPDVRKLSLRREIGGPKAGESFGFGAAGASLAVDPGNRGAEEKCAAVGEQACTAGHLLVYDESHKAVDEFDATGEFLDQLTNPALADASPTAMAIDRSGGPGDGTIYVSVGAGAGARLLAFGPLAAPGRAALPALSRVLKTASLVATDFHGNVYVRTGGLIHVYAPNGAEIKVGTEGKGIADPNGPADIAVDSAGRVYVLDEGKGFAGEAKVTYYTPSAYPPVDGTTYTRHEPPIVTDGVAGGWPNECGDPRAIAVNPANDHLFVTTTCATRELDSAAPGHESALLNGEFAAALVSSLQLIRDIAVDGASGNVYFVRHGGTARSNGGTVVGVNAAGTEVLARINGGGAPKGELDLIPGMAVDQSDGHLLTFQRGDKAGREYDASGAFVAEFGKFGEGFASSNIAIDNACALHDPPLTESTSPTCAQFDPANGNVYVAYDDPTAGTFDLTAFGPLEYPTLKPPVEFPLTVTRTGTGLGTVTSSPSGIDCGPTCAAEYEEGTVVTLTPSVDSGSEFTGWTGCDSEPLLEGVPACIVTMSEAKSVSATFALEPTAPKFTLTVATEGSGTGTIASSPGLISCSPFCSEEYEEGTKVTLTATAAPGSIFYSWKRCDAGGVNGRQCTVTMDKAKAVTAIFATTHSLTLSKAAGSGLGKVQSSPGGILCLANCQGTSASFLEGAQVTLTPMPAKHFAFAEWLGDCTGSGACTVTMGEEHGVEALFTEVPKHLLSLTKFGGGGNGTVKSNVAGISCGATCSSMVAAYFQGTVVELTATPGKGSTFGGWEGGGCSGTGTCTVTMSEAKSVEATFK